MKQGKGLYFFAFGVAALVGVHCGSGEQSSSGCNSVVGGSNDPNAGIVYGYEGCVGLQCQVATTCPEGRPSTTLTGVVNIPKGNLPLYNATVFVPNSALPSISDGPGCDRCSDRGAGNPVATTTTNYKGEFTLTGVPSGDEIPLVIQLGKWRREVKIAKVDPCASAAVDVEVTRLPRNQAEGHLPRIALSTGGADPLECLLRKIGLDESEFTTENGSGRINFYNGAGGTSRYANTLNGGANFTAAPTWWGTVANLNKYDVILHACEGTNDGSTTNKSVAARQAFKDYVDAGGRVFLSHWHHYWVEFGPAPFPSVVQFQTPANHQPDLTSGAMPTVTADIDTTFERGKAMADWLLFTQGSTQLGKLVLRDAQNTVRSVTAAQGQAWINYPSANNVQYLSFNTPVGTPPNMQCGRTVISDIHVSNGDAVGMPFPGGCTTTDLSPQEKALIFMFFDLSACIETPIG